MAFRRLFHGALALVSIAGQAGAADRFVATTGSDSGSCAVSASPCASLTYALSQAGGGDAIKMAGGSFVENVAIDASATLAISGGWSEDFSAQDPVGIITRIRGLIDVTASSGEVIDLNIDAVTLGPGATVTGIRALADADGTLSLVLSDSVLLGGGIGIHSEDTASVDVTIGTSRISRGRFSGVFVESFSTAPLVVRLVDSAIELRRVRNTINFGAGIHAAGYPGSTLLLEVTRSVLSRNRTLESAAGAITALRSSGSQLDVQITDSVLSRNRGTFGGALSFIGDTLTITNSAFIKNRGQFFGGGASVSATSATIANSTFTQNRRGGLALAGPGAATLRNTIVFGNSGGADLVVDGTLDADHNDLGIVDGVGTVNDLGGNISADPMIVRATDFHLSAGSPCIGAGTCTDAPTTDIDGDPRPTGGTCDIGADEFVP